MNNIAILASWSLVSFGNDIYIPTTHYIYLDYVSKLYNNVYLVSPCSSNITRTNGMLLNIQNVNVIPLPSTGSYAGALLNWKSYYKRLKSLVDKVDMFYCRVPDPFSWMPSLLFKRKTIMHFVGDTIDATKHNEKWSQMKKKVMIAGYLPDYWLTLRAARRSRVFTNGPHLAERLAKHNIKAIPVISSTVLESELQDNLTPLPIEDGKVIITYIGYIRFAKGMNCLMDFCNKLHKEGINYHFHLIGNGEMQDEVETFLKKENLQNNVTMHGLISDRSEINNILRKSDMFFFPSLSEGSPRVIIEAMAQGVPVISTPVGSLPGTFKEGETIRFFDFNDTEKALSLVREYIADPKPFEQQRQKAYKMVAEKFTLEKFLSTVFKYEE